MISQEGEVRSIDRLWTEYARRPDARLREQLIERCRPLALAIVNYMGYRNDEDLQQVALLGLVKAVDRFDPDSGNRFSTFAVPTILGEVKRYLRDQSRLVRPPRSLHDLHAAVLVKQRELVATYGRIPTLTEVADVLGAELEAVVEAMAMEEVCVPCSLHGTRSPSDADQPVLLEECLGARDPELDNVEARLAWEQIIESLHPPLKQVVALRYYEGMTQKEAADRLGVSQMQISRLERRALDWLRVQATELIRAPQ